MPRRHRLVFAATAALAAVTLTTAGAAPAQACRHASASPGDVAKEKLRRAVRCLVNEERARRDLRRLRRDEALGKAARRHADDMVERGYFDHERPGSTLRGRLRDAGWDGAVAAEAIAWGCGSVGTPRAIVDGWLESPPHREILLGRYNRSGVGLALGAPYPTDCPGAGTWVLDVGRV
jgi:uncharacterized protein YkwD